MQKLLFIQLIVFLTFIVACESEPDDGEEPEVDTVDEAEKSEEGGDNSRDVSNDGERGDETEGSSDVVSDDTHDSDSTESSDDVISDDVTSGDLQPGNDDDTKEDDTDSVGPQDGGTEDTGKATDEEDTDTQTTEVDTGSRKPEFQKTNCIDPGKIAGDKEVKFPCNGVDLWIYLPEQCITSACGLIFNIHGGGMSDRTWMEDATNMVALGKANDYVVVHPHKGTWRLPSDKNVVFGLMEQAIKAFDVDRKRIHATGYSQGGQISWALACEHADIIASVAPIEEINRLSDCWKTKALPMREIPVLFAYGRQDSIGGGYSAARQAVNSFVQSYSMTGPETIAGAEGTAYLRQRWTSDSGNVIEFISHNYTAALLSGHCIPQKGGNTFVNCNGQVAYNWGEEAVAFFKVHPMP